MFIFDSLIRHSILFAVLWLVVTSTQAEVLMPSPPQLAAKSYVLMDFDSGQFITENNSNEQMDPASLTKIMTAYVIFHELKNNNIGMADKVHI